MNNDNTDFRLILVDPDVTLCTAWREAFKGVSNIAVVHGYFETLPKFDCMVSAANSFGIMDGGVDAAITRYFGGALMSRVQDAVLDRYLGEQPVGTSMIIETGHTEHPFLAHTPTMRIPMPISQTDNVYLAMWAMLLEVRRHNRDAEHPIATVACPGLGTGYGKMTPHEAARQMATAVRHYQSPPAEITSTFARERQYAVQRGGDQRL